MLHCALALLGALIVLCQQVSAATFNIADGDVAALRAAITPSNMNGQDDTIDLAPNGSYILESVDNFFNGANGLPVISTDSGHKLVINGHGAALERNSTNSFRILQIGPCANVTINNLTVARGMVADSPSRGGGILSDNAILSINNCTFSQTKRPSGAASILRYCDAEHQKFHV
jgi:hypothetical protein